MLHALALEETVKALLPDFPEIYPLACFMLYPEPCLAIVTTWASVSVFDSITFWLIEVCTYPFAESTPLNKYPLEVLSSYTIKYFPE